MKNCFLENVNCKMTKRLQKNISVANCESSVFKNKLEFGTTNAQSLQTNSAKWFRIDSH